MYQSFPIGHYERSRGTVCGATLFIEFTHPSRFQYFEDSDIFLSNIKFRSIYLKKKEGEKFRELIFELKMIFET